MTSTWGENLGRLEVLVSCSVCLSLTIGCSDSGANPSGANDAEPDHAEVGDTSPQDVAAVQPIDPERWTTRREHGESGLPLQGVAYGNGTFVTLGPAYGPLVVLRSSDGVSWESIPLEICEPEVDQDCLAEGYELWECTSTCQGLTAVAFGNDRFVAVGPGAILSSPDGVTWRLATRPQSGLLTVTFGAGRFVAAGEGSRVMTSENGADWESTEAFPRGRLLDVAWGQDRFLIVGLVSSTVVPSEPIAMVLTSPDGASWGHIRDTPPLRSVAWGGSTFVASALFEPTLYSSPDGHTWTEHAADVPSHFVINDLVYTGDTFIGVGSEGIAVSSSDGLAWAAHQTPVAGELLALAHGGSTVIAVGEAEAIVSSP